MGHKLASSPSYPVLCLSRKAGLAVASTPSELARCSAPLFWRGKFYDGLRVIDAEGHAYDVVAARVERPRSRLGIWLARLLDLSLLVHVTLEHIGLASLSEIRDRILEEIDDDSEAFEEMTGHDVPWWRQVLAESKDARDLVSRVHVAVRAG